MRTASTNHHKVFSRIGRWSGKVPEGFAADFLGTLSRKEYFIGLPEESLGLSETLALPPFDEEYFEWIDLLEAVTAARSRFTMLELGAGWGRWTARGAAAAEQLGIPYRLVAVEAEPKHFEWMAQSLRDNGVRGEDCQLIRAAVTDRDGDVGFHVGGEPTFYGHCIGGPTKVSAVSLRTLLLPLDLVDLIDMDVQGAELDILGSAVDPLQQRVKRVHVETHNRQLHADIEKLFRVMGWRCHCLFEGNTGDKTPWGRINFQGGVQSWLNPALHSRSEIRNAHSYRNSVGFRGLQIGRRVVDQLAPIGTTRRKLVRTMLSGFAGKYQRDVEDEKLRPVGW
jgi:FkbM family methyltransferase